MIYDKESYSQSKVVFLAGPIEWWWQEGRFDTPEAEEYRQWRDALCDALVSEGFLVFRPFEGFKGSWNERMQSVNDYVLARCDVVIDMTPPGVVALGTQHEVALAKSMGIPILAAPPN